MLLFATNAHATPSDPDLEALDRRLVEQLTANDPEATRLFVEANGARDSGDLVRAAQLYEAVTLRQPTFDAAIRRRCYTLGELHDVVLAVSLCRQALAIDRSYENLDALALVLTMRSSASTPPTQAQLAEAVAYAGEALGKAPDDFYAIATSCQVSLAAGQVDRLDGCSAKLRRLRPHDVPTWLFSAIAAISAARIEEADAAIERLRALGAPAGMVAELQKARDETARHPSILFPKLGLALVNAVVAWCVVLLALYGAGIALSNSAMRHARGNALTQEPTSAERWLRRTYRAVIVLCCVFYYVSVPLVILTVIGVAVGGIYLSLLFGWLPVGGLVFGGLIALATIWALLRSVFVRSRAVSPGVPLDRAAHPRFEATLREVAERIGTDLVDTVYLTPATELAVTERGGMTKRLRGKTERALILGVGVLDGMTIRELKAILAHEYGHFRNRDTAGGGLAMAVTRSLIATTINLAKGGAASNFNPGWLFVRAFLKAFVRISQGASRLQEVLADRWAIHAYGSAAFANGLRHVVTSSVRFDAHADATVEEVLREDVPLSNLYRHEPTKAPDEHALATEIADAMGKTTPYDSHPSPEARIDLAEHVDIEGVETDAHDDEEAWALFSDRTALEHAMTAVIRERLAVGGVHVRAEAADANSRS